MTIEITLLPISCRTFHKITRFVGKVILNLVAWGGLIDGTVGILFPKVLMSMVGIKDLTNSSVFLHQFSCGLLLFGAILMMIGLYDIKIHWCIKEKSK